MFLLTLEHSKLTPLQFQLPLLPLHGCLHLLKLR
jgi:hypothetical protein